MTSHRPVVTCEERGCDRLPKDFEWNGERWLCRCLYHARFAKIGLAKYGG